MFLFDNIPVSIDKKQGKSLNDNVPSWFVKFLLDKEKEIDSEFFGKNTQEIFKCDYVDQFNKPDPDNPGRRIRPGEMNIPTTVDVFFSDKDGGDNSKHRITFYQEAKSSNDTDAIDGVRYVTKDGLTRYVFRGNLYLDRSQMDEIIFLNYFSDKKDKIYKVIDDKKAAKEKAKLRKLYKNIITMISDDELGLSEKKVRQIAAGAYNINNSLSLIKDIEEVRNELLDKIDAQYNYGNNAEEDLEKFIIYAEDGYDEVRQKAFCKQAIDNKAILIRRTAKNFKVCHNNGTVNVPDFGNALFSIENDTNLLDELHEYLFYLNNSNAISKIEKFLGTSNAEEDDTNEEASEEEELKALRAQYRERVQKNPPPAYINNKEWFKKQLA